MRRFRRIAGFVMCVAAATGALVFLVIPGCIDQNQDNSPISISNSQGRLVLSMACSADGSVAYVADGRNVYRYDRSAPGGESWVCILSQGERLEMAVKHDPREQPPTDESREKTDQQKSKETETENKGK